MSSGSGIQTVLVAGGGTMGQSIAAICVSRGFSVHVFDTDPKALEKGIQTKALVSRLLGHDSTWIEERTRILGKLQVETRLDIAAQGVDLVVECLPELLKLKSDFFRAVSRLIPPSVLLATNSSMLVPSQLREGVQVPGRFAALHFNNETEVAEIMGHDATDPETIQRLEHFVRELRFLPVTCRKEKAGCVLNSMLTPLNFSALTLAAEGCASTEDIDRLWMLAANTPRGPFANLDLIGLDTAYDITRLQAALTGDPQLRTVAEFLKPYVQQSRLGVKTFHGFYKYPNPSYAEPGFCRPQTSAIRPGTGQTEPSRIFRAHFAVSRYSAVGAP